MDNITTGISEVIGTLDAARSNARALDLALAAQKIGATEITISATASADANPSVRFKTEKPLELNDSYKAQAVTDAAKDIEFLADLYAAGQDIENFMRMEQSGDLTNYIIDFGGNLAVYIATLRSVVTAQLNTAMGPKLGELMLAVSGAGIEATPASPTAPAQPPLGGNPALRF